MKRFAGAVLLLFLVSLRSAAAAAPRACPTGSAIATFKLLAKPVTGGPTLPVSALNALTPGETLVFEPVGTAFKGNRKAEVALILVGEDPSGPPEILPARRASAHAEWRVPARAGAIGIVLGPRGIDEKKLEAVLRKDPAAVDRLADYADQTSKVEALVQTLSNYEQSAPGTSSLQSVLNGFSSQYGVNLPTLDRTKPADQQAAALLRAVTPAFTADPASHGGLVQQSGGLAASVASLFFGPSAGLAIGGVALVGNLHASLFPPTDFQSAFTQAAGSDNAVALCTGAAKADPRARLQFVWMLRLPDAEAPLSCLVDASHVPLGWTADVGLRCASVAQLKALPHARDWQLVASNTGARVPATIATGETSDTLALDLRKVNVPPGEYHLVAMWDWTPLPIGGAVDVRRFADLSSVSLASDSQDRLTAGSGRVDVRLEGADFEFLDRMTAAPASAANASVAVDFALPKGKRGGEQRVVTATIDTTGWKPGRYVLSLTQLNGTTHEVPLAVHAANPTLAPLPVKANVGQPKQIIRLHGTGLERVERISSRGATWTLTPVAAGARDLTEREAEVHLDSSVEAGEQLPVTLFVRDLHAPIELEGALQILGPRPKILTTRTSVAGGSTVELREGELPAGVPVSFVVQTEDAGARPTVRLDCDRDAGSAVVVAPGQKTAAATLDVVGENTLFLSVDPGGVASSGCALTAILTNAATGSSDPYALGHVVRLPRIDTFTVGTDSVGHALYAGTLVGQGLETIEKTGWNATEGFAVRGIATPVQGSLGNQTLAIAVPWPPPSPHAALYIWLRGEKQGRLTQAKY